MNFPELQVALKTIAIYINKYLIGLLDNIAFSYKASTIRAT